MAAHRQQGGTGAAGAGHFQGWCERFPEGSEKVPHVGWDHVVTRTSSPIAAVCRRRAERICLLHPLVLRPHNDLPWRPLLENPMAAGTRYIKTFAAAVEHENVMGVQFHPEKSSAAGLRFSRTFWSFDVDQTDHRLPGCAQWARGEGSAVRGPGRCGRSGGIGQAACGGGRR